jgi:hypothetical protein
MRIITAAIIAATAVSGLTATAAFADTRLSDAQFIKVSRCAGLAGPDAEKFNAVIKANKRARADFVLDRALNAKNDAARELRNAREGGKAEIAAELSGVCASLAG